MATDKIQTGIRFEYEVLRKITYIAKNQKRSLNAQIEYIVQGCIEEFEAKNGVIDIDMMLDD